MSSDTGAQVNSELPDGDALNAFAADAFAPRRPRRSDRQQQPPETAAAPAPVPPPAASTETPGQETPRAEVAQADPPREPSAQVAHRPRALPQAPQPGQITIHDYGPMGTRPVQCTVMVARSTRDRLAAYQMTKKMETGKEPTNAHVVRRAFAHASKNGLFAKMLRNLQMRQGPADEDDYDVESVLGGVSGRRTERGRIKDTVQQSFRPTTQELAGYDAFAQAYDFPTRSEFLDALLDEFLPKQPGPGRRSK